ncbi:endonuclease/exonuclease/phosphatase family protein [Aureimonas sp. AU40]|uniref:endonuclease/exonuclease/phosphatase family protein n=1 Tax=Aureimonas sp. AU40 TaxID=1637747 RepID=UPI000785A893|nr:endonuclease/exonuclease/phosphatase family protein [Aureimonas sp. AU40]
MSDRAALRVATWNIHGFLGEGRRPDFERTLRLLRVIDADLLALQEVDARTHLRREPFAFERLREALGDHCVEARLFGPPGRDYGQLLWSRYPLEQAEVHLLPGPGFEPRAVIEAVAATPLGPVRVLATHFGLRPAARRRQAAFLAQLVRPGETSLTMGDLNEWRPSGVVDWTLRAVLPLAVQPVSWPAKRPLVPMDRLYASADLALVHAEAFRAAAPASDHLPVVAEFRRGR